MSHLSRISPRRCAPALAAVAALLGVSAGARAQNLAEIEGILDEAVVEGASKAGAQVASSAPATTTTITADDLRRYGIKSLDEALNFLSLGMITENPRE